MAMASNVSGGSGSSAQSRGGPQVLCYHNEIAPLREVKHSCINQGREFYGCEYWPVRIRFVTFCHCLIYQRSCGFFKWAEEVNEVRDLQLMLLEENTIFKLEHDKYLLDEKVKKLKQKKTKLVDQVEELSIENTETKIFIDAIRADRKWAFALIVSWVFFAIMLLLAD
ncbi:DNA topoisomerase 3-alpha [Bienertia sinuspersici]